VVSTQSTTRYCKTVFFFFFFFKNKISLLKLLFIIKDEVEGEQPFTGGPS
jgi:hypothetical protein